MLSVVLKSNCRSHRPRDAKYMFRIAVGYLDLGAVYQQRVTFRADTPMLQCFLVDR